MARVDGERPGIERQQRGIRITAELLFTIGRLVTHLTPRHHTV